MIKSNKVSGEEGWSYEGKVAEIEQIITRILDELPVP